MSRWPGDPQGFVRRACLAAEAEELLLFPNSCGKTPANFDPDNEKAYTNRALIGTACLTQTNSTEDFRPR